MFFVLDPSRSHIAHDYFLFRMTLLRFTAPVMSLQRRIVAHFMQLKDLQIINCNHAQGTSAKFIIHSSSFYLFIILSVNKKE